MSAPDTNSGNQPLALIQEVCLEERNKLPSKSQTTGESIHALIIEVIGDIVTKAMRKELDQ